MTRLTAPCPRCGKPVQVPLWSNGARYNCNRCSVWPYMDERANRRQSIENARAYKAGRVTFRPSE